MLVGLGREPVQERGEAAQLTQMHRREPVDPATSEPGEPDPYHPPVGPVRRALDQTGGGSAIDEADDAVMPADQPFGELADRRSATVGMSLDRQQELVLRGRQPGGPGLCLTPLLEPAQCRPEFEQVRIVPIGQSVVSHAPPPRCADRNNISQYDTSCLA
jgi:hypothetical protein